jgi:hypothetical protein
MRKTRTGVGTLVVLAATMGMTLSNAAPAAAHGDPSATVPITGTILQGGGPSGWDIGTGLTGCNDTGFTPVVDGTYKANDDAFDNGLVVAIDGTAFDDADGNASMTVVDQVTTVDNTTFLPLKVTRTDRALHTSATLRTLLKFTNTGGTPANLSVEWDSDLGSDANTEVRASSNGNDTYQLNDRWAISSDDPTTPDDPVLTFVMFGTHANTHPDTVVTALGNDQTCFTVDTPISVPGHGTRYLLFFTEMNKRVHGAVQGTHKYDVLAPGDALLTGIKQAVLRRIENWNL